jgi:hypothetical protein
MGPTASPETHLSTTVSETESLFNEKKENTMNVDPTTAELRTKNNSSDTTTIQQQQPRVPESPETEDHTESVTSPLPNHHENTTIPNITSKEKEEAPIFYFPKGIWSDKGMHFSVTKEQEQLFQPIARQGATTCPWNRNETQVSQECMDLLSNVTRDVKLWYFLGDSTIARPWQWCLVPKLQGRSKSLKSGKNRGVVKYLGISQREKLTKIKTVNVSRGEGPRNPGHFYRSGCNTCENRLIQFRQQQRSSNNNTTSVAYAEFLSVDYARDVEFATTKMETTQDTIARYMQNRRQQDLNIPKNQTACVISSGMHDLLLRNMTSEVYISNHIAMKQLFKGAGCDIWIKLELTAQGFRGPSMSNNPIIFEWNEGIKRSMEPDEYQIDLFARSLNSQHGDNVHMDPDTFYCPLADFFIELMGVDDVAWTEEER